MLTELINTVVTLAMLAVTVWFLLAIGSMRFRSLTRVRRWYSRMLLRCATFLMWKLPLRFAKWVVKAPTRSGAAHMVNPPRLTSQEDDRW